MSATPGLERVRRLVLREFPDVGSLGIYNPRHIGNNAARPWSQHAGCDPARNYFGNAWDIAPPRGLSTGAGMEYLDRVDALLLKHHQQLDIYELIWRSKDHFDHIHVSTYPRMANAFWMRHPTKGGTVQTVSSKGVSGADYSITDGTKAVLELGAAGRQVKRLQRLLNRYVKPEPRLEVDGLYGPMTAAAVATYQVRRDLPIQTGDYDAFTRCDLERVRKPKAGASASGLHQRLEPDRWPTPKLW